MPGSRIKGNLLLVEDYDLVNVVTGIMRHQTPNWETNGKYKVPAKAIGSAEQLLDPDLLQVSIQESGLKALGLIVDADNSIVSRWVRIRDFAIKCEFCPPDELPETGLVVDRPDGLRFGAWIMPNNKSPGMVETFCHTLRETPEQDKLWHLAERYLTDARELDAPWKDTHHDRAQLYTYLASQDPPGTQMGEAITKKILSPTIGLAEAFAEWMRDLYQLERVIQNPST